MLFSVVLLAVYRILCAAICLVAIYAMVREREWQKQLFALLVFIPFVLRAAGVK